MLVQLPGLFWDIPDGKAINNALRILDGDVPYRDFWTMYAPGHFYLGALLFWVLGTHLWVQALAAQVIVALDAVVLFGVLRRLALDRRLAMAAAFCLVAVLWETAPELGSYPTALLFLLLSFDRVTAYVAGRNPTDLVLAGGLCGIAAWFKHDVAFHVTVAMVAGLTAAWILTPLEQRQSWVRPLRVLLAVAGGAMIAALPVAAFLVWQAWPEVWHDLIVFPATDFRVVRGEGYPALLPGRDWFIHWLRDPANIGELERLADRLSAWAKGNLAQIVFVAGFATVIAKRHALDDGVKAIALVCLAAMPLFWASAHVQQNTHFHSMWLLGVVLGTLAWTRTVARSRARRFVAAMFALFTAALLVRPAGAIAQMVYFWPDHAQLDVPAASGVRLPRWKYEIYQPILSFIRQHVPPGEPIYVGLVRNDAVVISNQSFYYLAGRPVASPYNELHPGITDRAETQREIIQDVNRLGVRCAVLWDFGWSRSLMDGILAGRRRVLPEIGSTVLDEFFRTEFREVARYGEYVVMWRKDAPLDSSEPVAAIRR
jgi:hypothetical protein